MTRRELLPLLVAQSSPLQLSYRTLTLRSPRQAYETTLRILEPRQSSSRLLLVLPVNADVSYRWGDGFETVEKLALHQKYGFVVAAPTFTTWPWYADHPTNEKIQQESYLLQDVLPMLDQLYPSHKRLLVGFSKSGNGAFSLFLRYPQIFHAAAAWDAPLMKTAPDQYEMADVYFNKANFEQYAIPTLLAKRASILKNNPPRLALSGYDAFEEQTRQAHELMRSLAIPHHYDNSTRRPHRWDSGWLQPALDSLDKMSR